MKDPKEKDAVAILRKYVPIVNFEPPPDTVEASAEVNEFMEKMKSTGNRESFVRAAWQHKSGSNPFLYKGKPDNGIEWKIRKALETNGLFVDKRFVEMCDEGKGFPGTKSSGRGKSELKWTDIKETKATKKFVTDDSGITDEFWKSASGIAADDLYEKGVDDIKNSLEENVGLWRFILGWDLASTRFEADETGNLALFEIGLGQLAYAIFQILVSGIPDEVEVNVWFSIDHKTLRQQWLKEDNVAPTRFWYEVAVLFVRVFLHMFLVLGVKNTREVFTIMGTQFEIDNTNKKDNAKVYSLPETIVIRSKNEEGRFVRNLKFEKPSGK